MDPIPENPTAPVIPPVQPASPPKKPFPFLLLFAIIILIAFSGSIAYLFAQNMVLRQQLANLQASPSPIPTPAIVADPTADWKTYTGSEIGFSFKYPANFGNQGLIAGPFTGKSSFLQSFSDPLTIRDNTDAPFDGFSVYVVTDMKTSSVDQYLRNELSVMNENEFSRMQGARRQEFSGGTALVTDSQGYYYFSTPDPQKFIVFVYLQANPSFKQTFDQILSTFKFMDTQPPATPTVIKGTSSLYYQLPSGWKTIRDETGAFEIGYDSEKTTTSLTYGPGAISIFINGTVGGAAMAVYLKDYDGGSRHAFIFTQMGIPPTKGDAPEKYKEVEYVYNGKSCLFLENLYYSQSPTIWGMCDVGNGKAILMTASIPDYKTTLQTVNIIK